MARASNYWNFKSTALKFYKSIASKVLKTGVRKLKEKSGNYHDANINFHVFNQGTQINWSFKLIIKKPVKNIFLELFQLNFRKKPNLTSLSLRVSIRKSHFAQNALFRFCKTQVLRNSATRVLRNSAISWKLNCRWRRVCFLVFNSGKSCFGIGHFYIIDQWQLRRVQISQFSRQF